MKKILGLDSGTSSLGWALLEFNENEKPQKILDCGVRIFQEVTEAKTKVPKNQARREARGQRRVIQRKAKRVKRLALLLKEVELLPSILKGEKEFYLLDPYLLRNKGITEKLSKIELSRIFLHLCKRRGFLSNRKTEFFKLLKDPKIKEELAAAIEKKETEEKKVELKKLATKTLELKKDSDDKEEKKTLARITFLEDKIKQKSAQTLGEYLYKYEEAKKRGLNTSRAMYEKEFNLIWEKQSQYHQFLDSKLKKKIYDFIFFQNPLKIQKFLVGKCTFESNKKKCYKARLEYQEFQIWQNLHNIRFLSPNEQENIALTKEQKETIFEKLSESKTMSWKQFRKILKLNDTQPINLELSIKKGLSGNTTNYDMLKNFPEFWANLKPNEQNLFLDKTLSIIKDTTLYKSLRKKWQFTPEQALQFIKLDFKRRGYANLSLKAIQKLLPFLRENNDYHDSCQKAGYEREDQKKIKIKDKLPYVPDATPRFDKKANKKKKLYQGPRNPTVTKALNETRKVVNAIIEKYGTPDIIRLEMSRDLKNSKKKELKFKN